MGGNYSKKENKRWVKWWLFKEKTVRWLGFFLLSVGYFPLFFLLGGFVLEPVHWPRALPCTCAVLCSKYRTNLWGWKPSQHLSLPTFLWENELRRSNIKFRFSPKTFTHELECLGSLLLRLDFLPCYLTKTTFSRSVGEEEILWWKRKVLNKNVLTDPTTNFELKPENPSR